MMKRNLDERLGGGYKQREKRRNLEAHAKLQPSGLAKFLVLKPPPLDIPPPIKLCLY